jgi:hypothetical protein
MTKADLREHALREGILTFLGPAQLKVFQKAGRKFPGHASCGKSVRNGRRHSSSVQLGKEKLVVGNIEQAATFKAVFQKPVRRVMVTVPLSGL